MEQVFAPLVPMLIGAGVFRVSGEVIAAVVRNRFVRGLLILGAFALWGTWHVNYMLTALSR